MSKQIEYLDGSLNQHQENWNLIQNYVAQHVRETFVFFQEDHLVQLILQYYHPPMSQMANHGTI
jgi:hypothetical protein